MRISKAKFEMFILMIFSLVFYYCCYFWLSSCETQVSYSYVVIFSWIGIFAFSLCLANFRRITGKWFSLYTIYFIFLCLFMFGQCFMWAFGIHDSGEIGKVNLFRFGVPATTNGILLAQNLSITGIVMLHAGFCLFYTVKRSKSSELDIKQEDSQVGSVQISKPVHLKTKDKLIFESDFSNYDLRVNSGIKSNTDNLITKSNYTKDNDLYVVSCFACFLGTVTTFYSLFRTILVNQVFGYGATLYNADVVASQINIILLLRMLFFPSLVGLLVGSNFDIKVRRFVYILFTAFSLVSLLAGDRGEWIFPLFILFWIHHNFVNPIKFKRLIVYISLGIVLVFVSVAVRNVRISGVTVHKIVDSMFSGENAIFSAFFEFGRAMQHSVIFLERKWDAYPYGNTYLLAFLGMVTEALPRMLINGYSSLSTWYSTKYLSISYGAGFSIIAEALINFGPMLFWIPLFIYGALFSRFFIVENTKETPNSEVSLFMKISITYCALQGIRNTTLVSLKMFIFSTVLIYVATYIFKSFRRNRFRIVA